VDADSELFQVPFASEEDVDAATPAETAGAATITSTDIPAYSGNAYVEINGNVPFFTDAEMTTSSYEYYSELDSLGRCGVCVASIGTDLMPTEERGTIGSVKPTGWHTVKYTGIVDGNYLYNRCHLIAYELAGENANVKNLITGTRYMNINGMLPFENMTADYVRETGNHVMYRVTPIFEGSNLVASGVLMEAKSVEDNGAGLMFNVFCYNVQPGIAIDYATGDSETDGTEVATTEVATTEVAMTEADTTDNATTEVVTTTTGTYAVNANNGKIHIVGACPATEGGSNAMKNPVYFNTYEEAQAYSEKIAPSQSKRNCGNCW
jgi:DNA-entry nuclease